MLTTLLIILLVLWLLGYVRVGGLWFPDTALFYLNGRPITLLGIFIFFVLIWTIGVLPSPLREIATILFILWILSSIGIIFVGGLANILLLFIIIALLFHLLGVWF